MDKFVPVGWVSGISPHAGGRFSYYSVTAVPTNVFDGIIKVVGGNYSSYRSAYESRKNVPAPLTITFLSHSYSGNNACVSVKVKLEETITEGVVCYIILWEDEVQGGNTVWSFVERDMPPYEPITITNPGQEQIIKRTFTLQSGWKRADLGVSVIVQKLVAKEVLNGRGIKLVEGVGVAPTSLGRVKALYQ